MEAAAGPATAAATLAQAELAAATGTKEMTVYGKRPYLGKEKRGKDTFLVKSGVDLHTPSGCFWHLL